MKCPVNMIRWRATNLLLSYPRQEGTWDSILRGKIANWVREMEEDGGWQNSWLGESAASEADV
jgi:hypothetical protein